MWRAEGVPGPGRKRLREGSHAQQQLALLLLLQPHVEIRWQMRETETSFALINRLSKLLETEFQRVVTLSIITGHYPRKINPMYESLLSRHSIFTKLKHSPVRSCGLNQLQLQVQVHRHTWRV